MNYDTAYARWAGVGPYYAMFPLGFAEKVVRTYTKPGERILDPFAGRASSVFAGASLGRPSIGIEINPVGWIYGKTKLDPAPKKLVIERLDEIDELASDLPMDCASDLPVFFRCCFSRASLRFLLAARDNLDWRKRKVDRTLMTLILIDLHGGRSRSFSNQMRQSRAMHPDYSIRWWRKHKMKPPQIDPKEFLLKKIAWRYAKGLPETTDGIVILGNSCAALKSLSTQVTSGASQPFALLFTSPPYIGISDYHRDQWLRLWMLGGKPIAARDSHEYRHDFQSQQTYGELLTSVFSQAAEVMSPNGYVYVRTDARRQTFEVTRDILRESFPKWKERVISRPYERETQTALYGDKSPKPGEKDIVLRGPRA